MSVAVNVTGIVALVAMFGVFVWAMKNGRPK